jgi:hypothetical protein
MRKARLAKGQPETKGDTKMAQSNKNTAADTKKTPLHDIFWTLERFNRDGQKTGSSWFRCGAIWPVQDHPEMLNIDIELLNPATGEPIKFRFVAKTYEPRQA